MAWKTSTNDCTLEVTADGEASGFSVASSAWKPPTAHLATLQPLVLIRRNSLTLGTECDCLNIAISLCKEKLDSDPTKGQG